jgi:hypothetical protein
LNFYLIRLFIINILKEQLNSFLNFINNCWMASLFIFLIILLRRFRFFRNFVSGAIRRICYFFSVSVFFFAVACFLRANLLTFFSLLRCSFFWFSLIASHFSELIIIYVIILFERFSYSQRFFLIYLFGSFGWTQ